MEELGLEELTDEQIEELCLKAEEAARKHVLSRVASKNIETLNIAAEAEGAKPLSLKVEVNLELSPSTRNIRVKQITDEAVKTAFTSAEEYLRGLVCRSEK